MLYKVYNPDNVSFISGVFLPDGQKLELNIAPHSFQIVEDCGDQINKTFAHLEVAPCSDEEAKGIEATHSEYLETLNSQALSKAKYAKAQAVADAKKATQVQKRVLAEKQAAEKEAQAHLKDQLGSKQPKKVRSIKPGKGKNNAKN